MSIPNTYPGAPPLSLVFAVPTQEQHDLNPQYWDAYKVEQSKVTDDCPSATNVPEWNSYHNAVTASLPPVTPGDTAIIGSNQCVYDASNWEWQWNPNSGHNKVFS